MTYTFTLHASLSGALPPVTGYAAEGALLISVHLSTGIAPAGSTLRLVLHW